jgi:hypothetical protein
MGGPDKAQATRIRESDYSSVDGVVLLLRLQQRVDGYL